MGGCSVLSCRVWAGADLQPVERMPRIRGSKWTYSYTTSTSSTGTKQHRGHDSECLQSGRNWWRDVLTRVQIGDPGSEQFGNLLQQIGIRARSKTAHVCENNRGRGAGSPRTFGRTFGTAGALAVATATCSYCYATRGSTLRYMSCRSYC